MAAKGYSTPDLVAAELGVTFTPTQEAQVDGLIEAAEAYIDHYTGRSWLEPSPATEVTVVLQAGLVYLSHAPVTAVTSVNVRTLDIGADDELLVVDEGYELLDPANGVLLVSTGYRGHLATVAYTHTTPVPADIQRATTLMVTASYTPRSLGADMNGVDQISLGSGEISVKYGSSSARGAAIPDQAQRILLGHRKVVFA